MKGFRSILSAILLSSIATISYTQVYVGARGGASLTKTMGSGYVQNYTGELSHIITANGGIFLKVPIAGGLSFRPEVGFTQTGAGFTASDAFDLIGVNLPLSGTIHQKLSYVQAPVLLEYEFGGAERAVAPYIVAGPTVGYLIDAKTVSRASFLLFRTKPIKVPIATNVFNRFEVGAAIGAGLNFSVGNSKLFVEGRYNRGFTRVYDTPVIQVPVYNQAFSLMAGMAISL